MADWLDDIEAHLDSTVPYYVPRLIAEIRRLRQAESPALGEWRPIESAPKMQTIILFAVTEQFADGSPQNWKMATGAWHTGYDCETSRAAGYTPWTWDGRQLKTYDVQPTHWLPIPSPPISGSGSRGRQEEIPSPEGTGPR